MKPIHRTLAFSALTLGAGAAITGAHSSVTVAQLALEIDQQKDHISAEDVGERLMKGDNTLHVFDLRSEQEFELAHIPGALLTTLTKLSTTHFRHDETMVLYSNGGAHAAQAWMLLRMRGYRSVYFLREGLYEWDSLVANPRLAKDPTPTEKTAFERALILSRFFGGEARFDVARDKLPLGYWTETPNDGTDQQSLPDREAHVSRRRGC